VKDISLERYADFIREASMLELRASSLPDKLLIMAKGDNTTFYAPFDYINEGAQIVIVGITPGHQQAVNALVKAKEVLMSSGSIQEAKKQAKVFASFSGAMRNNLTAMMDKIGIHTKLGISSSSDLFEGKSDLVHFTSALRYPVFNKGKNFNGSPLLLEDQLMSWFAEECKILRKAIYIPLGPKVSSAMDEVVKKGILKPSQVLSGLPHPSGANAERIQYFLGKKDKERLSIKTNPRIIDDAKQSLIEKMQAI
jgi:hypothetical protein